MGETAVTARCPVCGKDTRNSRSGVEHCMNRQCSTEIITRNGRGEAEEARNPRGQLVYRRRMQAHMDDDTGQRTAHSTHRDGSFGADPGAGAGNEFLFGGSK